MSWRFLPRRIPRYIELRQSSKKTCGHAVSETATFNFVGESASGKTLAAMVAASVTGNPRETDRNGTLPGAAYEEYLESRNEIGAIFDDVEKSASAST